ncbi:MAG: hypothetical protein EWV48_00505 [Microcystis aeruginosa Ma_QC_C_20070823_S13]|nr:MAG: hypothetical protein EWV56_05830 [Microcystis aeruginosa Ma_QC_C_20070823_S13D]TRU67442.1 MAG: hypothetical protein EWV48_00505 [Microcystis aeruginosa Ma_QC_C_20070823_S13]
MGFLNVNYLLKLVITSDFITQSKPLGGSTPQTPRAVSFKLSTADFESINLTEDSQVYLSITKRVSHNN